MSNNDCTPTIGEYQDIVENIFSKFDPYALEWSYANVAGWEDAEYEKLLTEYLKSTQLNVTKDDDATNLKGIPLEELSKYFLEKGGFAREVTELKSHGEWQIDGQGRIVKSNLLAFWQPEIIEDIGPQLFLECKNHKKTVSAPEFTQHHSRMVTLRSNLSVIVSTSGFSIGKGLGISETVFLHSYQKKYHLLLSIQDLCAVVSDNEPPISILTRALLRVTNNRYRKDEEIQKLYSETSCHEFAKEMSGLLT